MANVAPAKKAKPLRARNKFLHERKEQKRRQAKERQAAYDALTYEQKIAKLDAGGYVAAKQRIKLAQAQTQPAPVLTEAKPTEVAEPPKEKKGAKARRQARKDKKANG